MKRCLSLLLVMFLSMPVLTEAQSLTNKERRHINTKVLNLVEEYERTATVHDDEAQYVFRTLFEDVHIPIICDMIGFAGYLGKMTVDEYIDAVSTDAVTSTMEIKDLKKGEMTVSGTDFIIPVTFRKSISYVDRNGYVFSTEKFYETDLVMDMSVRYNPETDVCTIISLDGRIESEKKFPDGRFYIINKAQLYEVDQKYHRFIPELQINGSSLSFNEFDQAVLPAGNAYVSDIDMQVFPDTLMKGPNYDVMKFDFDARGTRLKLHYGYAPFGAYKVTSDDFIENESAAMEAGVDIGFTWMVGKKSKMGFFFGAGMSMSQINLALNDTKVPLSYSYKSAYKNSGDFKLFEESTFEYKITSATEGLRFIDIYVPLYFEFEHRAGNHVLVSWNFGVKGYCNMSTDYKQYEVTYDFKRDGVSKEGLTLSPESFISPSSYKRNPFDVSAFGNLGLDINIGKRKVYLSFKGGYEYGLTQSYSNDKNQYFKEDKVYPIIYDMTGNKHIAVHSLITNLKYRRRAIWLQAGLKFKI